MNYNILDLIKNFYTQNVGEISNLSGGLLLFLLVILLIALIEKCKSCFENAEIDLLEEGMILNMCYP